MMCRVMEMGGRDDRDGFGKWGLGGRNEWKKGLAIGPRLGWDGGDVRMVGM